VFPIRARFRVAHSSWTRFRPSPLCSRLPSRHSPQIQIAVSWQRSYLARWRRPAPWTLAPSRLASRRRCGVNSQTYVGPMSHARVPFRSHTPLIALSAHISRSHANCSPSWARSAGRPAPARPRSHSTPIPPRRPPRHPLNSLPPIPHRTPLHPPPRPRTSPTSPSWTSRPTTPTRVLVGRRQRSPHENMDTVTARRGASRAGRSARRR